MGLFIVGRWSMGRRAGWAFRYGQMGASMKVSGEEIRLTGRED